LSEKQKGRYHKWIILMYMMKKRRVGSSNKKTVASFWVNFSGGIIM
jgi:hypothetical protein